MTALSSASAALTGTLFTNSTGALVMNSNGASAVVGASADPYFLVQKDNNAGNTTLKVLNDTANAASTAGVVLQTGTANSTFQGYVVDNAHFLVTLGSALTAGLIIQAAGVSMQAPLSTLSSSAIASGSATQAWLKASSTANLGIFYGTGNPSFSAAKGSIYSRTDASIATARLWNNSDGGTTWVFATMSA
mgnify:FL=1